MSQYFIHNRHRLHQCLNLRYFKMLCTKWAHFKFDACYRSQNSWDGHVYHGVASPLLLKTAWRRPCIEVIVSGLLESGPILAWYRFKAAVELWSSLTYFSFMMLQILYRWKIWTAGQFSTWTLLLKPCCCNSCSMWFCIVLLKYTRPSLK